MKKSLVGLAIILIGIVILSGCSEPYRTTQLTIVNNTGEDLELVEWNDYYFDNTDVWDETLGEYCHALLNGTSVTRNVTPGDDSVGFWHINGGKYYTNPISVSFGQHITCFITSDMVSSALMAKDLNTAGDWNAAKKTERDKAKNNEELNPKPTQ